MSNIPTMPGVRVFKVGGCVRDEILGLKPKDIDFAVEAPSYDLMKFFILGRAGKIFQEKPEFLTIRAKVFEFGVADFVLCRKDGEYKDGRHPETVQPGTILDDLSRRDFTMNAIAVDAITGEVIDPFNGRADIDNKLIKCVGDPIKRFEEDKLRMFRALRFSMTKRFTLDKSVFMAIHEFSLPSAFDAVSTERIREELLKMFAVDSWYAIHLINQFSALQTVVQQRGIWFKPTTEER